MRIQIQNSASAFIVSSCFCVILSAAKDLDGRSDDRRQQRTPVCFENPFPGPNYSSIASVFDLLDDTSAPDSSHPAEILDVYALKFPDAIAV